MIKELYYTVLSLLFSVLAYIIFTKIIDSILKIKINRINDGKRKTVISLIKNVIKYVIVIIEIVVILKIFRINTTTIVAGIGIIGAVIGLAFQDLLKDLITGIFIIFEDQYRIGEYVAIDNFKGEVIFLGLKSTKIKSLSGEIKIIPNGKILNVVNYSREKNSLTLTIASSYENKVEDVETVISLIIEQLQKLPSVSKTITYEGIEKLNNASVLYMLTIPCKFSNEAKLRKEINKVIKEVFDNNNKKLTNLQLEVNYE